LQKSKALEIKFYPHRCGKQGQAITYATLKEHIESNVQRPYNYGKDLAG